MILKLRSFSRHRGWKLGTLFLGLTLLTVNFAEKNFAFCVDAQPSIRRVNEWKIFGEEIDEKEKSMEVKKEGMAVKDAFVISYPCHYQCYRYSSSPVEWNNLTRPIPQYNRIDTLHHLACTVRDVSSHFRIQLLSNV